MRRFLGWYPFGKIKTRDFNDVNWGWGLVITSLIFAMHVLGLFNPFLGKAYWD